MEISHKNKYKIKPQTLNKFHRVIWNLFKKQKKENDGKEEKSSEWVKRRREKSN